MEKAPHAWLTPNDRTAARHATLPRGRLRERGESDHTGRPGEHAVEVGWL